jgi:hypothetical protein
MHRHSEAAWELTVRVQDVILRAVAKQTTWYHVVASGRDPGDLRPQHEALEGALRGLRL